MSKATTIMILDPWVVSMVEVEKGHNVNSVEKWVTLSLLIGFDLIETIYHLYRIQEMEYHL